MSQAQADILDHVDVPEQYGLSSTMELNAVTTGVKAAMKEIGSANDMFMADPRNVKIWPGFNARIKDDRYWERVGELADSIEEHGFYKDKPLACYVVKEDGKNVVYIVEGGRRLDASLKRQLRFQTDDERDAFRIPLVPKERETNEVDLVYGLAQGNNAEPFRPYELAVVVKRLKTVYGQTEEQILKKLKGIVSSTYLTNLLIVAGAPRQIADMVIAEELSVTQAAKVMNQHGNRAIDVLLQAKANAKAEGKEKVSDRFMPGKKLNNALKKEAPELYRSAQLVMQDPGFAGLTEETRAVLEDLMRDLKAHEDAPLEQANEDQMGLDVDAQSDEAIA